ncbi:MAG: hypothetical protein RIS76_3671, partial [Verrucomicrobiota bacterium]
PADCRTGSEDLLLSPSFPIRVYPCYPCYPWLNRLLPVLLLDRRPLFPRAAGFSFLHGSPDGSGEVLTTDSTDRHGWREGEERRERSWEEETPEDTSSCFRRSILIQLLGLTANRVSRDPRGLPYWFRESSSCPVFSHPCLSVLSVVKPSSPLLHPWCGVRGAGGRRRPGVH